MSSDKKLTMPTENNLKIKTLTAALNILFSICFRCSLGDWLEKDPGWPPAPSMSCMSPNFIRIASEHLCLVRAPKRMQDHLSSSTNPRKMPSERPLSMKYKEEN